MCPVKASPRPTQRAHTGDRTKTGPPPSWALDKGAPPTATTTPATIVAPPPRQTSGAPRQRPKSWAKAPLPTRPKLAWSRDGHATGRPRHGQMRHQSGRVQQRPSQHAPTAGAQAWPGRDPEAQAGGRGCEARRPRVGHHRPRPSCRCWPAPTLYPFESGVSLGPRPAAQDGPSGQHRGGGRVLPLLSPRPRKAAGPPPPTDSPTCFPAGPSARRRRRMESRQCTHAAVHRCGSTIYYQRR